MLNKILTRAITPKFSFNEYIFSYDLTSDLYTNSSMFCVYTPSWFLPSLQTLLTLFSLPVPSHLCHFPVALQALCSESSKRRFTRGGSSLPQLMNSAAVDNQRTFCCDECPASSGLSYTVLPTAGWGGELHTQTHNKQQPPGMKTWSQCRSA